MMKNRYLPPDKSLRLMIVDDHSMVRMGFAALLASEPGFRVVAEAEDALQAVSLFREVLPDITLMDVRMPGESGLVALASILREFPSARIIMLTTYDLELPILRSLELGASGYLLKSIKRDELVRAVRRVHGGETCFPVEITKKAAESGQINRLTPREHETLDLIRRGLTNRDIGLVLGVTEHTAKAHVKSLFLKLDVADRAEAVAVAFERGLLQVE
jgi:two-component system, NarL family, response regulator